MPSLLKGLRATRNNLAQALTRSDAKQALQELERGLLLSDAGTKATEHVIKEVEANIGRVFDSDQFTKVVNEVITSILLKLEHPTPTPTQKPHVILLVGTNGGGKTTTAAKLAHLELHQNHKVVLAAADTFRAAAQSQLSSWADKMGDNVHVVTANDPGAAAYSGVTAGLQRKANLVIVDTAGRQPTSKNLMNEATKIYRAIDKAMPDAPHECLLALDANTGQNALRQIEAFSEAVNVTGLVLTKLDSTARGGITLAISLTNPKPIRFIGVGEKVEDMTAFDANDFAEALFSQTA